MRQFNLLSASILAALMLVAALASTASAAGPGLVIKEGETPLASGATAYVGVNLDDECLQFDQGTLTSNGKSKDKAAFTAVASIQCEEGVTMTGSVSSAEMTSTGLMELKSTLVIKRGECAYEFKKLSVTFPAEEGGVIGFGTATGKLDKAESSKVKGACEKTATKEIVADLTNSVEGEPFLTEVS